MSLLAQRLALLTALVAGLAVGLRTVLTIKSTLGDGGTVLGALWELARYFTIWMNTAVLVLTAGAALAPRSRFGGPRAWLLVLPSIVVVGTVFYALLAGRAHHAGVWGFAAEHLLHAAVPSLAVLTFLAMRHGQMEWRMLGWGIALGAIYGAYLLIRGAIEGDYPYWFVNVPELGLVGTLKSAVMLMGTFALISAIIILADRLLGRRTSATVVTPP